MMIEIALPRSGRGEVSDTSLRIQTVEPTRSSLQIEAPIQNVGFQSPTADLLVRKEAKASYDIRHHVGA
jgi:hypothetical protein